MHEDQQQRGTQAHALLDSRTHLSYIHRVKGRQLIRKFRQAGVEVIKSRGKGGHFVLRYQACQTTLPFHGDTDLAPQFVRKLCKQLGLDPRRIL